MQYTDAEKQKISIEYQRAARNCNDRAWQQMTPQEKLTDLQYIENYNAMQQGRIPSEVTMERMDEGLYGYHTGNSIVHNEGMIRSENYRECVNTNYHEGFHSYVEMAEMFPEVNNNFAQEYGEDSEAMHSVIPDYRVDYDGYYNHPQEVAAREEGNRGVEQMEYDKSLIMQTDAMQPVHNQILETYDYDALSMADDTMDASVEQENDVSDFSIGEE